jgi:hypothetical protein
VSANSPGLYEGVEKVQFIRADFDSLLGQFFQPITNKYEMSLITNSLKSTNIFQRVVTTPDILFHAEDLAVPLPNFNSTTRNANFFVADRLPGLAGPGTIQPSSTITFNKVGDIFMQGPLNATNVFLSQNMQRSMLAWGSFDGSTNDPVVYPNGTSIDNLQNEAVIQITLTNAQAGITLNSVPDGTNNVPYPTLTFLVTGGAFTPPYTWSANGLPSGLTVTTDTTIDPNGGGQLSGTPTQTGEFPSFILQMTDYNQRSVSWTYPINIQ